MGDLFARGGKLWEGLSEFVDEGIIRQLGLKLEGADLSRLMNTIREFTDISQLVELFGEKAADFLTRVMAGLEGLTDEPRQLTKLAQKLGLKIPIEPRK